MKATTALVLLVVALLYSLFSPRDDTDPPDWGRSGMSLHTDNKTGCQYLSRPLGGIAPRLDGAGRHMGCKP